MHGEVFAVTLASASSCRLLPLHRATHLPVHPGQQGELRLNSRDERKVSVTVKKRHAVANSVDRY